MSLILVNLGQSEVGPERLTVSQSLFTAGDYGDAFIDLLNDRLVALHSEFDMESVSRVVKLSCNGSGSRSLSLVPVIR